MHFEHATLAPPTHRLGRAVAQDVTEALVIRAVLLFADRFVKNGHAIAVLLLWALSVGLSRSFTSGMGQLLVRWLGWLYAPLDSGPAVRIMKIAREM